MLNKYQKQLAELLPCDEDDEEDDGQKEERRKVELSTPAQPVSAPHALSEEDEEEEDMGFGLFD